jgi:hemolysin III
MIEKTASLINNPLICPISGQTPKEEKLNFFTHFFGFILSLIGAVFLFWSYLCGDFWHIASCCIYLSSLIGLYAASSFYHRCNRHERKKILKIFDHSLIYLFIAGTYTPFTLGPLRASYGWELFFILWGIALIGVIFKIVAVNKFQNLSLFSYLLMGWLVTLSFPTLIYEISSYSLMWLITGGLSYTTGTLFFAWESLAYSHVIWHLFVLIGSLSHYLAILNLAQNL